jgi:hypothetical protein
MLRFAELNRVVGKWGNSASAAQTAPGQSGRWTHEGGAPRPAGCQESRVPARRGR